MTPRGVVRVALGILALVGIQVGLWAAFAPRSCPVTLALNVVVAGLVLWTAWRNPGEAFSRAVSWILLTT